MKISNLKDKIITCAAILALVLIMYVFEIPCLFKTLLHISCPGCGITRAYISLFRLEIEQAFRHNAMFWAVPFCALFYLFDDKIFRRKWLNLGALILLYGGLFVNWVIVLITT